MGDTRLVSLRVGYQCTGNEDARIDAAEVQHVSISKDERNPHSFLGNNMFIRELIIAIFLGLAVTMSGQFAIQFMDIDVLPINEKTNDTQTETD
jgi:hypothetical protein